MTLKDNKKITLGLIEEYSPTNQYLTDDEDIRDRLNLVYSTNYQELSQLKGIIKTTVLRELGEEIEEGYEEISLPDDLYQIRKIVALNDKNEEVTASWNLIGDKVYINKSIDAQYILEYNAYPTVIKEDTSDNFELELDQDAQMILPYAVANDILKVDPSSDYTAFYREYQRKMELLDKRRTQPTANIVEGII